MTEEAVRALGHILACNARVLGMQAENMQRSVLDQSMAYSEDEFNQEAFAMENIARNLQP
ncbi:MAG: hypothetical protein PF495_00730 [Spirochaetales bacterium]|jgi:hypothetical protein|nr:hypothetical protein [Spirochaetales bacterium]